MKKNRLPKYNYIAMSAAVLVFVLTQLSLYQFYFIVPITLNGKKIKITRGETLESALKKNNFNAKYGRLLDVERKVIPNKKGYPPEITINNKKASTSYALRPNDNVKINAGADKTENIVKKIEEVQSKIIYTGKGSFIYVTRKGRPGIREVIRGLISKKIVRSKWLVTPLNFTIKRTNIRYRNVVALTFDDGPSKYTSLIMKILKENKAKASFFILGRNVKKRAKLLKIMAKRNYTIGNHTYNHISLRKASTKRVQAELKKTDEAIFKASGVKTKWVRPPSGALSSSAISFVLKQNYHISLWNIDTLDWQRKSPKKLKQKVLENLKAGQVILMHDGGGYRMPTARALPGIIKAIKKAGYRLVSLDDLYRLVE